MGQKLRTGLKGIFQCKKFSQDQIFFSKAQGRIASQHPLFDYFQKALQATNLIHTPMTQSEALKILELEQIKNLESQQIMKKFMTLYNKNEAKSVYLQAKVFNAKEFLMKEFPGAEEQYVIKNKLNPKTYLEINTNKNKKQTS